MEPKSEPTRGKGRPKGSRTAPEKRKPITEGDTRIVSARVTTHVARMLAADAEQRGLDAGTLLAQTVARRWPCKCDECVTLRRDLRRWERQRQGHRVKIVLDTEVTRG
jgi:hypothetical protein